MLGVLSKFGSGAHLYIPGIGTINGITAGNYLDSIGSSDTAVDGLVGFVLDAAGAVGPELITDPSFDIASAWTLAQPSSGSVTISGGALNITTLNGTVASASLNGLVLGIGKTYRYSITISAVSGAGCYLFLGGTPGASPIFTAPGTYTGYVKATGTGMLIARAGSTASNSTITDLSLREVPGISASQATTGSKPFIRRGAVNYAYPSNDFSSAGWIASSGATKTGTNQFNFVAAQGGYCTYNRAQQSAVGLPWTFSIDLSGSGDVKILLMDNGGAYPQTVSPKITLTSTPTRYSITRVHTDSVATAQVAAVQKYLAADGDVTVIVGRAQLEKSATQSAYIETVSGPTSANVGAYSFEFDGVDDYFQLPSVPLQMADDFSIIAATRFNSATGDKPIFCQRTSTALIRLCQGDIFCRDDAGAISRVFGVGIPVGTPHIISARKTGNIKQIRRNSGSWTTDSTALGTATFSAAYIGYDPIAGVFMSGAIYSLIVVKGTISDVDLLAMERGLNALSGYAAGSF